MAGMTDTQPSEAPQTPEPVQMWLNAMGCVRPTDEFATQVGRDVIAMLMRDGAPKSEPLDPYRTLVVKVMCS